jgi:CheY-like chemotaxis protein
VGSGAEARAATFTYMRETDLKAARRVLLIADDRRFRALACTLLTRRGYSVAVCPRESDLVETAVRERADVVVIDASASLTRAAREAARLGALVPPVGIVAVSADSESGLAALPVIPKWSPFEALFEAIERARPIAVQNEVSSAAV